jgi:hypothetical protein
MTLAQLTQLAQTVTATAYTLASTPVPAGVSGKLSARWAICRESMAEAVADLDALVRLAGEELSAAASGPATPPATTAG